MILINRLKGIVFLIAFFLFTSLQAQQAMKWAADGNAYYRIEENEIVQYTLPANSRNVFATAQQLTPTGATAPITVNLFSVTADQKKVLLYTNATRVWRIKTRGD